MISEDLTLVTRYYRQFRLCVLSMLLFLIATLAMMFIMRPLVFVMLAIAVVFHLFVLRPKQKAYADSVFKGQSAADRLQKSSVLTQSWKKLTRTSPKKPLNRPV